MKTIQIVELKNVLVPAGSPVKLVGNYPHCLGENGLDPDHFTPKPTDPELWRSRQGIFAWPSEPVERSLWLVNYIGEYFKNYEAVHDRLLSDNYSLMGFPELCAIKSKADELWDIARGVLVAMSTSPDSFWRSGGGALCVPYLDCHPVCYKLNARRVNLSWYGRYWFVVGAK